MPLNEADTVLLGRAQAIMAARRKEGWHEVAAALRTKSGAVFAAVHLEAYVGRIAVCAEAVALGMAAAAGDTDVEQVVAVDKNGNVVSPCGMCRELLLDYAPHASIIVKRNGALSSIPLADLLPDKYVHTDS